MTKWAQNGRKRSCKTSCLAYTFFSICKLLLDTKKKKEKKRKLLPFTKIFSLANEVLFFLWKFFTRNSSQKLLFTKVFVKNFVIFFVKFLLVKVSAPKVTLVDFIHILTDFYHLPVSLVLFTHSLIDACEFAQVGLNHAMN